MKAEFIGVGKNWGFSEAAYENLCAFEQELTLLGIETTNKSMVADHCSALFDAVRDAIQRSDVIFLIGGLGGKQITHKVLCGGLSLTMRPNEDARQSATAYFESQNLTISDNLERLSKLPEGSLALPNANGPLCGAVLARKAQCILSLPEHPDELFPMLLGAALPFLSDFLKLALHNQSFVVWDSSSEELAKTLHIPPHVGYTAAAYRIGSDPARHLVRVSIRQDMLGEELSSPEKIQRLLESQLQGFAIENESQPILQTVMQLAQQKKMGAAVVEYGTDHAMADAVAALPDTHGIFTYNLDDCRLEVRKKVFGMTDRSFGDLGTYAAETSAYMARGVREVEDAALGLAVCRQKDGGCTLTATDGSYMLFFADVACEEIPTAAALLLYRFIKAYPALPHGAGSLESIVGKNAPNPRVEKLKAIWKTIKEG